MRALVPVALAALCASCGSASPPPKSRPVAKPVEAPVEVPNYAGGIPRSVVDEALQKGLGRFLRHVEVTAVLDKRQFIGWKILALHPASQWDGVGLSIGDVVTRVNGFPIGRIEEAEAAFRSLSVASEIRATYLRNGQPGELRVQILDDVPPSVEAPPPAPSSSSSAK